MYLLQTAQDFHFFRDRENDRRAVSFRDGHYGLLTRRNVDPSH